jgi:hypothetical protein
MTTAWIGILAAINFSLEHLETEVKSGPIPLVDVMQGQNSFYPGPSILLIGNPQEWNDVWRATRGAGLPGAAIPASPRVNFSRFIVLGIMGGEVRETGDYRFVGGQFKGRNSTLRVQFVPYRGPIGVQARPYAFFVIRRLEGRVEVQMGDVNGQYQTLREFELPSISGDSYGRRITSFRAGGSGEILIASG